MAVTFPSSPSAGQQVTDSATGAVWVWQPPAWIPAGSGAGMFMPLNGVTDGSNAAAGQVGEYVEQIWRNVTVAAGSGTVIGSITLQPGDWDITAFGRMGVTTGVFNAWWLQIIVGPAAQDPEYWVGVQATGGQNSYLTLATATRRALLTAATVISLNGTIGGLGGNCEFAAVRARRVR